MDNIRDRYFETVCYPVSAYGTVVTPSSVNVSVQIDGEVNNRKMNIMEIHSTNGFDVGCEILDDVIENVVFCGRAAVLSELKYSDIMAIVDLSGFNTDSIGKRYTKKVTFVIDSEVGDEVFIVGDYTVQIIITEK